MILYITPVIGVFFIIFDFLLNDYCILLQLIQVVHLICILSQYISINAKLILKNEIEIHCGKFEMQESHYNARL